MIIMNDYMKLYSFQTSKIKKNKEERDKERPILSIIKKSPLQNIMPKEIKKGKPGEKKHKNY